MITLDEGGMVKLQHRVNQTERLKAVGGWHLFFWGIFGGCAQNHITEEMQEVRSMVGEDVRGNYMECTRCIG